MDRNLIKIISEKISWEQAIEFGVELLVEQKIATQELAAEIINSTVQHGPYYVIMPKVALAHTKVGFYNLKPGLSLIKFDEVIKFSEKENHQVNLLFTLSAIDENSHMDILQKFATLFSSNPSLVDEIINLNTIDEIYEKMKGL